MLTLSKMLYILFIVGIFDIMLNFNNDNSSAMFDRNIC